MILKLLKDHFIDTYYANIQRLYKGKYDGH